MKDESRERMFGGWLDLLCAPSAGNGVIRLPVLSGSMLPFLLPGRLAEVRPARWKVCRAGDIIVIREHGRLTAHRLLLRLPVGREPRFFQKGDANRLGGWVGAAQVVGVVVRAQDESGRFTNLRTRAVRRRSRRRACGQLARCLAWMVLEIPWVRGTGRWLKNEMQRARPLKGG